MLPSLKKAHLVNGHKKVHLSRECRVNTSTFYKWVTGRSRCPVHKRLSVERALGASVDWVQYDLECDALLKLDLSADAAPAKITMRQAAVAVGDHTPVNGEIDEFAALYGECA